MRGSAFVPWLEQRIIEDSRELLVVDKPSGIPTHGGDETLESDVVSRLVARLRARGDEPYLGVHQRLDLGTSGVLLFVRDRSWSARVQSDFERGLVRKRYVAAVEIEPRSPLAKRDQLTLTHQLVRDGKRQRVAVGEGKASVAHCRVLQRRGSRALVELLPETGRTHQLRVQLSSVHAPIAGDREYGAVPGPRLLLHAESLELPSLKRCFRAPVPRALELWLEGSSELGDRLELRRKLSDAACHRYPLLTRTGCLRWVNGAGDELPGVEVDLYASHAVLSVSSSEAGARRQELAELLHELGAEGVYLKERARADLRKVSHDELAPSAPLLGPAAPEPLVVREDSLAFAVELGAGLSTGLFLDQRDNRQRVRAAAGGRRVLNLFSYTCSFSVAAALGGAVHVTSVDLSRRALRRGQANFGLNALPVSPHSFVDDDVVHFLERAFTRHQEFDLIILDPPSFSSSGGGKVLRIERDYSSLVGQCLRVLAQAGCLLAVTNHRGTSAARLRKLLLTAAEEQGLIAHVKSLPSGLDCRDGPEGPLPSKSAWLRLESRQLPPRIPLEKTRG